MDENNNKEDKVVEDNSKNFSLRIEAEAHDGSGTIVYKFDNISESNLEALNDFILFVLKAK